ncbi:hypothetical protein [Natronorubrum sp. DTA28]|uniref:hypothetical protein n=1 Tax=Natronorubrum sp. DTA28 TaxID=3447019 RepID=UPI003F874E95
MTESFAQSLRSELSFENPIAFAVVLALLFVVTDATLTTIAAIPITLVGLAVLRAGLTSAGAPRYASGIVVGAIVAAVCGAAAVLEGSVALGLLALAGGWLCLDSLYDRRHGIERPRRTDDPIADYTMREGMQYVTDARVVVEELRESPVALTPAQVADRTSFSDAEVESMLTDLEDESVIERVGADRYTVDERKMGLNGLVRDTLYRFCRPFSVLVPRR